MAYGMSYEQFWYGDPWAVKAFATAHLLRQRARNNEMWIQGAYFANALNAALTTAFSHKKENYVKEPFNLYPKTEIEEQEEIREKRLKLIEHLNKIRSSFKTEGN